MLCAAETVEETIVSILREDVMGGRLLHEELVKRGIHVSSQAVYNALKKLLSQEVVLKKRTIYELNYVWLKRLHRFSRTDSENSDLFRLDDLEDGDNAIYYFKNLNSAGAFWMHIHQILLDHLNPNQIAVLYSTNEWTSVIRQQQDTEWATTATRSNKLTLFAIGKSNPHNKTYKNQHESGNLQISVGKTYGFPAGYYLNVFNDYIVELIVPSALEEKISKNFQENADSVYLAKLLTGIGASATKVKLIIKRNPNQARKLFRKIAKDFHIPKEYNSPLFK